MIANRLTVIASSASVERLLAPYRDVIGRDFEGYRGHVYRVLTYAMHFLGGDQTHRAAIETALVYHDIGMWTAKELAYLEPSIDLALADNRRHAWGLDEQLLRDIIYWHHKVLPFHGPNASVVNAVRKADLIDVSGGRIRKGISKSDIARVMAEIPEAGFHAALERLAGDLADGHKFRGVARVLSRVYKW